MMRKGYPYKSRKKVKTNIVDNRPHLSHPEGWYKTEEAKEERNFRIPDIRISSAWDKHEAHALIDMWAEISWGKNSKYHKAMSHMVGYFLKLWYRQKGRCAVSGVQLFGAPGCLGHAIGIDIMNFDFGIRKGNIRLVSAPIAITRLYRPGLRTQSIGDINSKNYEDWPVFWAILKQIQWWLNKEQPFKWMPVTVHFPPPYKNVTDIIRRRHKWINFSWHILYPKSGGTVEAWKDIETEVRDTRFCSAVFEDDRIDMSVGISAHNPWADQLLHHSRILLGDPNTQIEKQVIESAKVGFRSLGQFLNALGKNML